MERKIKLSEISKIIDINLLGDDKVVNGLNLCNRKTQYESIVSFVTSDRYIKNVNENYAICALMLTKEMHEIYKEQLERNIAYFVTDSPESVFYKLHHDLYSNTDFYKHFEFKPEFGVDCIIHPTAFIDKGVILGDNVTIGAKSIVNRGSIIGNDVTVGCNSVIGSEGFQVLLIKGVPITAKHVGETHIKDCAYIGDNTAVCNSLFEGATIVGENAKIDNLVHVAHNCYVGKNAVITAGVILCGSSILEEGAWIGVNSSILNRVTVGKNALVGIGSVVIRDIPDNVTAYGVPAKISSKK